MATAWLFGLNSLIMQAGKQISVGKDEEALLMSPTSSTSSSQDIMSPSTKKAKQRKAQSHAPSSSKRITRKWSVQPLPSHILTASQRQKEMDTRISSSFLRKRSLSMDKSTSPRRSCDMRGMDGNGSI